MSLNFRSSELSIHMELISIRSLESLLMALSFKVVGLTQAPLIKVHIFNKSCSCLLFVYWPELL